MSRRAECAAPTCNSWTGISGNMLTSRRRSPWATRSPALHTRSVGSCPKWRDSGGRPRRCRARMGRWRLPPLPGRQYAHLSQRALARIRTGGRFCRVHPRPGSLSGQGEPSSEIRGTRAAHRCRYDTLPWHEKTSRCWRARPGSGDRGFGYRWTRRVCRSVRPTARRWCEGRRFRPQSRQARYREELWSRSHHQHQGQVLKRYCQGTQQRHGPGDLDAIIDCAGAEQMMQLGFSLLAISGHYVDVGLVGDRVDIPLFPRVSREQTFHGSYWGNNTDLTEVMALAAEDKIRHTINIFRFDQINEHIELLRAGEIVGRAVMKF